MAQQLPSHHTRERTASDFSTTSARSSRLASIMHYGNQTWSDIIPSLYEEILHQFRSTHNETNDTPPFTSTSLRHELISLSRRRRERCRPQPNLTFEPRIETHFSVCTQPELGNASKSPCSEHNSTGHDDSNVPLSEFPIEVTPSRLHDKQLLSGHHSYETLSEHPSLPPTATPTRVTATEDPVVLDQATAAAINLQRGLHDEDSQTDERSAASSSNDDHAYDGPSQERSTLQHDGSPPDMFSRDAKQRSSKRHKDKWLAAWKVFSESIRHMGLQQHSSCSYLERRPAGGGVKRNDLLEHLMSHQAQRQGKYVRWNPSRELALSSSADSETVEATKVLSSVLALRDDFQLHAPDPDSPCVFPATTGVFEVGHVSTEPIFDPFRVKPLRRCSASFQMEEGVYAVYWTHPEVDCPSLARPTSSSKTYNGQRGLATSSNIPSVSQFLEALKQVMEAVQHPACKTFAFRRLEYLQNKFRMHIMFNTAAELNETKKNQHRDFYNVRKVDTHVHHSACMHQKHLLRFIRRKYRTESDEVVAKTRDGRPVTLKQIFHDEVGVTAWEASVDLLDVHALSSCFHRFDIFNSKYNPFGQALLREVFLKTDNMIQGRYLAEITREVISKLEDQKYQMVEWRLSIYGKSPDEWLKLTRWVKHYELSSKQVRWMIQVPRLYHVYRKLNLVQNFGELLRNIFEPVFRAVQDPESNPEVFHFLLQMNGWDSVDDESIVSKYTSEGGALPLPEYWTEPTNPPYSYWAYYMYANIRSLNVLLASRGMRTLPFRPHCGETGSISHLASMYLLADSINHGIMLRKSPVLQYIYYLQQIGLALSPLSNNALFHDIRLNVSLSTDDPLMFHFTDEPLLEEYSCCAHVWKLSPVDLCEIARNSVLQSHFEPQLKAHWLGAEHTSGGSQGNDMQKTNVSNIRLQYREDTMIEELAYIRDVLHLQDIVDEVVG